MLSNSSPNTSVAHLGGNNLTTVKQGKLMGMIKKELYYMNSTFPSANIIWPNILPRLLWRDIVNTPENLRKMDQKRKRINGAGHQVTQQMNHSEAIIHEIDTTPGLNKSDGVHFARIGNAIFLNTMEEALMSFLITLNNVFIIIFRKKDFTQPHVYTCTCYDSIGICFATTATELDDTFRIFNTDLFLNIKTLFSEFAVAEFPWPFVWRLCDHLISRNLMRLNLIHGISLPQPGSVHLTNNFG